MPLKPIGATTQGHTAIDTTRHGFTRDIKLLRNMKLETANETDVREEIAVPILTALGYARGTANDIRPEFPLKHRLESKPHGPPLSPGGANHVGQGARLTTSAC